MRKSGQKNEDGISLLLSLLILMLLSAVAMGMMFMSSTETAISSNFKGEETAYFAARAGLEEVRDRALTNNVNTLNTVMPTTMPGAGPTGVLYVLQTGVTAADIQNLNGPLGDTELCHDFAFGGMTTVAANVPCSTLPAGGGWFTTAASVAPYALDYKWVRMTLKANNSTAYCVDGSTYPCGNSNMVCWNGVSEVVLPSGTASCNLLSPTANPVYMMTALAVTNNGARRMVQQEIAQTPLASFPYGVFATGTGCASLKLGGGAKTYSFNSATESPVSNPPSNATTSGGNVGSNGNVAVDGNTTAVNGTTGSAIGGVGNCNQGKGITATNGATYGTASQIPVQSLPVPPMPNPLPPTNNKTLNSSQALPPGSYGNVNVTGNAVITLAGGTPGNPAVYTFNSFSLSSNATLLINGPVVFNLAGVGQNNVLTLAGGFSNTTYIPSNFEINYGGTGNISISGGAGAYAVIDAPNANISFSGGSTFYGQAIGNTISDTGGTSIYYDNSLNSPTTNNNSFYEISMRELSY
jgi:hypothetical protein